VACLSLFLAFGTFSVALADEEENGGDAKGALGSFQDFAGDTGLTTSEQSDTLASVIGDMIYWSLSLVGIVLVILIIYGGFLWMTAGGNEEQVTKAKRIIKNAVIGVIIAMLAFAIAEFVLDIVIPVTV